METLMCNCCGKTITNFNGDLFHITGIIAGELNTHIHLCYNCFQENIKSIPVIVEHGH